MPTIPPLRATTGLYSSAGIINAILNDPNNSLSYSENVLPTTASIKMAGQYITQYVPRKNDFAWSLINMIGMVRIHYMLFKNPWSWAKQGKLEMGETVEQIWIDLCDVYAYNPEKAENTFAKQAKPKVRTAFHTINYKTFYKITINYALLEQAFLSVDGMKNFTEDLIGQLVRSASVDEFMAFKYVFATALLDGLITVNQLPAITAANSDEIITEISEKTNLFQFPSTDYTIDGVLNTTPITDLMVIESAKANAFVKVNSLAMAFNIDYVKFAGNVTMFDYLGNYDWDRMDSIFAEDTSYRRFTQQEINLLNSVEFIMCDRKFLQIYDSREEMGEPFRNGEGLYTNMTYHVWKILSVSPFHNVLAFSSSESSVTAVTITPQTASVRRGGAAGFQAIVSTSGFANSKVVWEISTQGVSNQTYIGADGVLHVAANETVAEIEIKATSVFDESQSATATVTITA